MLVNTNGALLKPLYGDELDRAGVQQVGSCFCVAE